MHGWLTRPPASFTPAGRERRQIVGTVEQTGSDVQKFKVGDKARLNTGCRAHPGRRGHQQSPRSRVAEAPKKKQQQQP